MPRHNPYVFFDDVTGTNNPSWPYGISHIRPYSEFASDLTNNTVARFNFITPNLVDDMHRPGPPLSPIWSSRGDTWLASEIPKIMNSQASSGWRRHLHHLKDEPNVTSSDPIGMIVHFHPWPKAAATPITSPYSHSSTLRTISGNLPRRSPFLGDAANAPDLSDLFQSHSISNFSIVAPGQVQFNVSNAVPGRNHVVQCISEPTS